MGDLLFDCSVCHRALAVDVQMLGHRFVCPGCNNRIVAPAPAIAFPCGACSAALFAPERMAMRKVACPNCDHEMTVPEVTTVPCPRCRIGIEIEPDLQAEVGGTEIGCPQCGACVSVPALPAQAPLEAERAGDRADALPKGFGYKPLRIDKVADAALGRAAVEAAKCPYCAEKVLVLGERTCVCKSCGRIIRVARQPG